MYFKILSVQDYSGEASSQYGDTVQNSSAFSGNSGRTTTTSGSDSGVKEDRSSCSNCNNGDSGNSNGRRKRTLSREEVNALVLTKLIVSRWGEESDDDNDE